MPYPKVITLKDGRNEPVIGFCDILSLVRECMGADMERAIEEAIEEATDDAKELDARTYFEWYDPLKDESYWEYLERTIEGGSG